MSDSPHHDSKRASAGFVPGVIYEWTLEGTKPVESLDEEKLEIPLPSPLLIFGAEVVAGYRLAERIGQGGTGEVWRAIGPGGVAVALKFINANHRGSKQELRSLAQMLHVRHANLVTIFGIWERDEWTAVGMDLADGSLLDRYEASIADGKSSLSPDELIDFFRQAARGLDFLNEPKHPWPGLGREPGSLAHRDIKPQNLLLVGGSVKVGDFGLVERLSKDPSPSSWSVDDGVESLVTAYTSPELRRGELSSRSDQYSLAATYCHLRGGRVPSTPLDRSRPRDVPGLGRITEAVDLSMLPASERPAVARAMATDPEKRWPTCSAFVEALVASAQGSDIRLQRLEAIAAMTFHPPRPVKPARRYELAIFLVLAVLALITAIRSSGSTHLPRPIDDQAKLVEVPAPASSRLSESEIDSLLKTVAIPATPSSTSTPVFEPPPRRAEQMDTESLAETIDDMVMAPAQVLAPTLSGSEIKAAVQGWAKSTRSDLADRFASARILAQGWIKAIPRLAPITANVEAKPDPPVPRTATIIVRMPSSKSELIVRGEVGRGNPDEWYGPRRVIHSPPIAGKQDYLVGALWIDPSGRRMSRAQPLKVEPGGLYEVDLRSENPTAVEVPRPPAS